MGGSRGGDALDLSKQSHTYRRTANEQSERSGLGAQLGNFKKGAAGIFIIGRMR